MLGGIHATHTERDRQMIGAKHEAMVDLGEIVILGSQPENWDGRNALPGQFLSQPRRRQSLVDGIGGAGEQAHLLTGYHRHGTGLGQPVQ